MPPLLPVPMRGVVSTQMIFMLIWTFAGYNHQNNDNEIVSHQIQEEMCCVRSWGRDIFPRAPLKRQT